MSTSGNAPRAACHWLTPNFYWLTQLSAISSPISLGQHTALTLQTFLRGSNTFALIFRTEKLKCEHPAACSPPPPLSRGPPLCTLLSVSIHPPFHTAQNLSLPCNYLHTHSCCCALGWETHSQNSRRFYILSPFIQAKIIHHFLSALGII